MKPTIPNGWRRLRVGTIRRKGDKYFARRIWIATIAVGEKIRSGDLYFRGPYIRRIRPRKAKHTP